MYLTLSFPVSISTTKTTTTTMIRTHDDDDSHARTTMIRTHTRPLRTHAHTHDDPHARTTTTHQDGRTDFSRLSEQRVVSGPHRTLFPAPEEARTDAQQAK